MHNHALIEKCTAKTAQIGRAPKVPILSFGDKIRKIRRDGTSQIQEAVRNDRMSINKAYKLIRDMELGTEKRKEEMSAARVKAVKSVLSAENLEGNLCSRINLAVEHFINGLCEKGQK